MARFKMLQNVLTLYLEIRGLIKNIIIEMYLGTIEYDEAD